MRISRDVVVEEHEWVHGRAAVVVPLVNVVRTRLGRAFDTNVGAVSPGDYHDAVDDVFAEGDRAVNVAALVRVLRTLDVAEDYPGFVVDELLGRELAAMVAGDQPRRLLGEATFHYADVLLSAIAHDADAAEFAPMAAVDRERSAAEVRELVEALGRDGADPPAGLDDLDAALAAGFQTRLPGWEWTERDSPFGLE